MANGITEQPLPAGAGAAPSSKVALLFKLGLPILAALLLVAIPAFLGDFRLGLAAKYLCLAFPAVAIVLIWGYGGILSLGQGIFFGLGGYMMAMFL